MRITSILCNSSAGRRARSQPKRCQGPGARNLAPRRRWRGASAATCAGAALLAVAIPVGAHELIQRYNLPVPFWLYTYGCAATLVVTFALVGWFMAGADPAPRPAPKARLGGRAIGHVPPGLLAWLRGGAVAGLAFAIVAGWAGTRDPDRNFALPLFWTVFLLLFTYLTALVGNIYEFVNPWETMYRRFAKRIPAAPPLRYRDAWGYWPAVAFNLALVWMELFTPPRPATLATALALYSAITFAGLRLFGPAWLRHAEVFGVLLRIVGMVAPVAYRRPDPGGPIEVHLRWPFAGLVEASAERTSLVVLVLLMLSATTYDALHQTIFWMGLYWNRLLLWLQPLWGGDLIAAQASLERWFGVYQRAGLLASPFLYLGIYLGVIALLKALTRTGLPLFALARMFAFSIVPIALAYNVAHYLTSILYQLPLLPWQSSDPLGYGWRLLPVRPPSAEPLQLDMAWIWHAEVALILGGHVVSICLAHRAALDGLASRRQALVSELPLLLLMVFYTVVGLWVISLPFALT